MADEYGDTRQGSGSGDWLPSNVGGFGAPAPGAVGWPPTVMGCYGHAWRQLWPNFWRLVLIGIGAVLIFYVPAGILSALAQRSAFFGVLAGVYDLLVGVPLIYGAAYAVLRAARGQAPEVGDLFVPFTHCYGASIGAAVLTSICTTIAFILFVIPGIIVGIRLSFVPFLVVDEGYGPVAALRESWQRTRGFSWTIFGMELLGVVISAVGVILLVIGVIPAAMWVYLSFAALFVAVTAQRGSAGGARQMM
ncbi:MAG TPA: hypothetical protein VGP33_01455 [Chloroflexota bacterium]|jgi:uncharacterized membrane protein|nr:hypothetical protein [Chloroflexota bacterium]